MDGQAKRRLPANGGAWLGKALLSSAARGQGTCNSANTFHACTILTLLTVRAASRAVPTKRNVPQIAVAAFISIYPCIFCPYSLLSSFQLLPCYVEHQVHEAQLLPAGVSSAAGSVRRCMSMWHVLRALYQPAHATSVFRELAEHV